MHSLNKTLTILVSFLWLISPVHAIIESFQYWEKGDLEICILGDLHGITNNIADRDKQLVFQNMVERLSQYHSPICFLLEASEHTHDITQQVLDLPKFDGNLELLYALSHFAHQKHDQYGSLRFTYADYRGKALDAFPTPIHFFTTSFSDLAEIYNVRNWMELEAHFTRDQMAKYRFYKEDGVLDNIAEGIVEVTESISWDDCRNEIKDALTHIKTAMRQIEQNPSDNAQAGATLEILTHFFQQIKTYSKPANAFFKKYLPNDHAPAVNAFFNLMKQTQAISPIFKEWKDWIGPLHEAIAGAGFFLHILKAQKDFSRIILFAGSNHALTIGESLKHLGFTCRLHEGLLEKTTGVSLYENNTSQFTELRLLQLLAGTFADPIPDGTPACQYCNTVGDHLLKCSSCKWAYYCNRDHQRKDWKVHKQLCKLFKEPIKKGGNFWE